MGKENNFKKEYKDFLESEILKPIEEKDPLFFVLYYFGKLGFTPSENLDSFREWFHERMERYDMNIYQLKMVLENFYDYWSSEDAKRQVKNIKSTFLNSFHLDKYLRPEYKTHFTNEYNRKD